MTRPRSRRVRGRGESGYRAFAIGVLRIAGDHVTELTAFHDLGLFKAFAPALELPPEHR